MLIRTEAELNRIAYEIRGAALAVHKAIGPGCFESAYMPCLIHELTKRKLEIRTQVPLTLRYDSVVVLGAYVADIIVAGSILLEIKALEQIAKIHLRRLQTVPAAVGIQGLFLRISRRGRRKAEDADGPGRQAHVCRSGAPRFARRQGWVGLGNESQARFSPTLVSQSDLTMRGRPTAGPPDLEPILTIQFVCELRFSASSAREDK